MIATTRSMSRKPRQKSPIEDAAADGRLQIEPDERHDVGDPPAVVEHVVVVGIAKRGQAEQRRVVAERRRELRLADRLRRRAADAGDHDRRGSPRRAPLRHRPQREARGPARAGRRPGSRIANCVVCTPTAMPPAPASQ